MSVSGQVFVTGALALLAACHGHSSQMSGDGGADGPGIVADGAADGAPDAGCTGCGPIQMTVYGENFGVDEGKTLSGIDVYFTAPDQTVQKVTTGPDGIALASAPPGTSVLVVRHPTQSSWELSLYAGLQPGDAITDGVVSVTPPGPDMQSGATIYFSFPAFNDATSYYLRASCGGFLNNYTGDPIPWMPLQCPQYGSAVALVYATDSQGNLGYTTLANVDYNVHNGAANPVTMPAWQPGATLTTSFVNLPMVSTNLELQTQYKLANDPTIFWNTDTYGGGPGPTQVMSVPVVPYGDHTRFSAQLQEAGHNIVFYLHEVDQAATTEQVDVGTMIHPVTAGHYDPATDSLVWTASSTGVNPSIIMGGIGWRDLSGDNVAYSFYVPGGTTASLPIPKLPSALSQLAYVPSAISAFEIRMRSYVGKTYHDGLVGQVAGAVEWDTAP